MHKSIESGAIFALFEVQRERERVPGGRWPVTARKVLSDDESQLLLLLEVEAARRGMKVWAHARLQQVVGFEKEQFDGKSRSAYLVAPDLFNSIRN